MIPKGFRPVIIASVCGPQCSSDEMLHFIESAAKNHPDLIILPEAWQGWKSESSDHLALLQIKEMAAHYRVNILHTVILDDSGKTYNSGLFVNREGTVTGRYDKAYPYWDELSADIEVPTTPGVSPSVFDTDFGRVGIAVCFDANFPHIWADMAEKGAELVVWPSAYAAGFQLAAHALNHHYTIVTASLTGHCMVFDIDGRRTLFTHCEGHHIEYITLDLDRCIFHENFNDEKCKQLLTESPRQVEIEKHYPEEQWFIVRSAQSGVSAREICRKAGMEELRDYKQRSREMIDKLR